MHRVITLSIEYTFNGKKKNTKMEKIIESSKILTRYSEVKGNHVVTINKKKRPPIIE